MRYDILAKHCLLFLQKISYQKFPTDTDTIITSGNNNGVITREPESTNLNKMSGSLVGRTYVKFTTPAHAGDDYIGVAHPESGLTITVTSDQNNPKAQISTTVLPDTYQSKLLTVWRTLWIELDRMVKPKGQNAASDPNPDGFAYADKGTKWDTTVPSSEPTDFDLLEQPNYPDISLLETAMKAACVDAKEATTAIITGWGLTSRRETPFVHNIVRSNDAMNDISNPSRDIINNVIGKEFWCVHAIGIYEGATGSDNDNNTGSGTCGYAIGNDTAVINVIDETTRDCVNTMRDASNNKLFREINVLRQIITFHEILHLFDFHDNAADDGFIMTGGWYYKTSSKDYETLDQKQIKKIQSKDYPR
jgi:hypothetical protein